MTGAGLGAPPGADPGGPKWSTVNKSASVTLSNFNLTATAVSPTGNNNVISDTTHASGKYYVEATALVLAGSDPGSAGIGVVNPSFVITTDWVGKNLNSVGYYADGTVVRNGITVSTIATFSQGDVIGIALDLDLFGVWFRVNGGIWNGNALFDPTTPSGGFAMSAATNNFGAELEENTEAWKMNFVGPFPTAPVGFGLW